MSTGGRDRPCAAERQSSVGPQKQHDRPALCGALVGRGCDAAATTSSAASSSMRGESGAQKWQPGLVDVRARQATSHNDGAASSGSRLARQQHGHQDDHHQSQPHAQSDAQAQLHRVAARRRACRRTHACPNTRLQRMTSSHMHAMHARRRGTGSGTWCCWCPAQCCTPPRSPRTAPRPSSQLPPPSAQP